MSSEELRDAVGIELTAMRRVVAELRELLKEVEEREVTVREVTAAGAFLAQFYMGVENILKRISQYHDVPPPTGEAWHIELFKQFKEPAKPPLPALFDPFLTSNLSSYRGFRHVVYHSYGFSLDWNRMQEGVRNASPVFERFEQAVNDYLASLPS